MSEEQNGGGDQAAGRARPGAAPQAAPSRRTSRWAVRTGRAAERERAANGSRTAGRRRSLRRRVRRAWTPGSAPTTRRPARARLRRCSARGARAAEREPRARRASKAASTRDRAPSTAIGASGGERTLRRARGGGQGQAGQGSGRDRDARARGTRSARIAGPAPVAASRPRRRALVGAPLDRRARELRGRPPARPRTPLRTSGSGARARDRRGLRHRAGAGLARRTVSRAHALLDALEHRLEEGDEGARRGSACSARALASGQMPEGVEEVFERLGLSLFPRANGDLKTACSCPDPANPVQARRGGLLPARRGDRRAIPTCCSGCAGSTNDLVTALGGPLRGTPMPPPPPRRASPSAPRRASGGRRADEDVARTTTTPTRGRSERRRRRQRRGRRTTAQAPAWAEDPLEPEPPPRPLPAEPHAFWAGGNFGARRCARRASRGARRAHQAARRAAVRSAARIRRRCSSASTATPRSAASRCSSASGRRKATNRPSCTPAWTRKRRRPRSRNCRARVSAAARSEPKASEDQDSPVRL